MDEFTRYVEDNWDDLYRLSHLLAGTQVSADDLLQDSLVKALKSWPRVRAARNRRAYMRRVMTTTLIDAVAHSRARHEYTRNVDEERGQALGGDGQEEVADRRHMWVAIAELPARQRAIVVLRYYEDLSERETARVLDCAIGTVKSQSHAALKSLAKRLPEEAGREG